MMMLMMMMMMMMMVSDECVYVAVKVWMCLSGADRYLKSHPGIYHRLLNTPHSDHLVELINTGRSAVYLLIFSKLIIIVTDDDGNSLLDTIKLVIIATLGLELMPNFCHYAKLSEYQP